MNIEEPNLIPAAGDSATPDEPLSAVIPREPDLDPLPRLGIIHLLAWITISAVLFSFDAVLKFLGMAIETPEFFRDLHFVDTAGMAAGIVGLVTLVRWRARHECGRLAPGHWILIAAVLANLLSYGLDTVYQLLQPLAIPDRISLAALAVASTLIELAIMAVYIFAAGRIREKRGWKLIFMSLVFAAAIAASRKASFALVFFGLFPTIVSFEALIVLFTAGVEAITALILGIFVAIDLSRVRRDWLHVLGVAMFILSSLTTVGYAVGLSFVLK